MNVVEGVIDDHITGLTRYLDEQNALITALFSRVGFLEQELEDMDCQMVRAAHPPTPVPGPPLVFIDLTDNSEYEDPEVILVEDDDKELIGGLLRWRSRCG